MLTRITDIIGMKQVIKGIVRMGVCMAVSASMVWAGSKKNGGEGEKEDMDSVELVCPANYQQAIEELLTRAITCEQYLRIKLPKNLWEDFSEEEFFKVIPLHRLGGMGATYKILNEEKVSETSRVKRKKRKKASTEPAPEDDRDKELFCKITNTSVVRILKAYRDPDSVELSPKEREALEVAEKLLGKIKKDIGDEGMSVDKMAEAKAEVLDDAPSMRIMTEAIFNWFAENCEYDFQAYNTHKLIQAGSLPASALKGGSCSEEYSAWDGKHMILEHKGVCDSYAQANWLLLQMAGIPCCMMAGDIKDNGAGHAWNLVYLGDHWAHVDPTWGGEWFDMSDEQMKQGRKWKKSLFPNEKFTGLFAMENELVTFPTEAAFKSFFSGKTLEEDIDIVAVIEEIQEVRQFDQRMRAIINSMQLPGQISCHQDPLFPCAIRIKYRAPGDENRKKRQEAEEEERQEEMEEQS